LLLALQNDNQVKRLKKQRQKSGKARPTTTLPPDVRNDEKSSIK
jgi:hypothetical protein